MNIYQNTFMEVEKDGKKVQVIIPPDMPAGLLFDALMEFKGYCVQRMQEAHAAEQEEADEKIGPGEPQEQENDEKVEE